MNPPHEGSIIGIDGSRLSVADRTGTETYTAQIIQHLAAIATPDTLRVYLRTHDIPAELHDYPGIDPVPIPFPRLWTHLRLGHETKYNPPDVLFVPAHVVPLIHPPTVVTIHDLGYLHHPESHPPAQRRTLDLTTRWSARAAQHIIAISESTKRDLVGAYAIPSAKITVIPHGVDPAFCPATGAEIAGTKRRLNLPDHFILTVGTVQPRKNLARLAAAMRHVAAAGLPHKLVIAGKPGWLATAVEHDITTHDVDHRVIRLGYVSRDDLPHLYAAAAAFALPSLYEGFGLPALEALATALPTLVSDRSALPEVTGDAALRVNPTDVDAIGAALVRLLTDQPLRHSLQIAGPARAQSFTWSNTAQATLAVLRRVIAETKPGP